MNQYRVLALAFMCVVVPFAVNAAPSVRALGGMGTFNGSNKAAEAKTNSTKSSSRTRNVTNTARASSARVATNSRLSIGKYLGGTSSVSGSASKPSVGSGLSGVASSDDLRMAQDSIADLENFVGYSETGDTIAEAVTVLNEKMSDVSDEITNLSAEVVRISEIDKLVGENSASVLELQEKLSKVIGKQVQVTYENGVLTLNQPGVAPQSFDLAKGLDSRFANKAEIETLNNRFNGMTDTFVATSPDAVQTLQGQYSVKGSLYVDTPTLPSAN